jgi:hypothetical protein
VREAGEGPKTAAEIRTEPRGAVGQMRGRRRVSRVAGSVAAGLLFALLLTYSFSMNAGGMDHMMSGDAAVAGNGAAADTAAPATGGQMVMPDGSVMNMGEHPTESPGAAATEADPAAPAHAEADGHDMEMGGAINWYVIGGILALIAAGIALAAGLNEHLERRIALGALVTEGVCVE